MNDQRSTAEPPSPIQSVIRAVRTVIRAEVRMRVERTGDISTVERAHTRLENAVRWVPDSLLPDREKKLLMDDVQRLGEIGWLQTEWKALGGRRTRMLTELEALVSDDTSSLIDDEGLARRWGSAAGLLDLAAQHGISQRVMKHLFVRLDDEPEPFPLLQFIAENEDSPDVVEQLFRAGLRNPTVVPICAELSRTIELVDYALHPGTEPQCYCGNSAKQKGFSGCSRHGYPRLNARGYLYCLSCLRFFDRKDGRILGFVERCIVMESVACRCGERIPKDPKPWARDRSAVECEHCGRKIHLNTGLVVGMVGMIARPKDSRK